MFDFRKAYNEIQEIKKKISCMNFDDACLCLGAYYVDDELADFDYGSIAGTIYNENGKAKTSETCVYSVYSDEWETEGAIEMTEKEIYERGIK